jgi:hypothetical protein
MAPIIAPDFSPNEIDTHHASLAGVPFRLDPQSINFGFTARTAVTETIGGKVVQVLGIEMNDLVVSGSFGKGGWEEQERFLRAMKTVANSQVAHFTETTQRFLWPARHWDIGVFLKSASPAVHDVKTVNLKWSLTLAVVDDNISLRTVAENVFIARLASGLGWKIDANNGGMSMSDIQTYLSGHNFTDINGALSAGYAASTDSVSAPSTGGFFGGSR